MDLNLPLQVLLSGLTLGSVYALVAVAFGVIYNTTRSINFVQGEYVMLGGVTAAAAYSHGMSMTVSILLALGVAVIAGLLTERAILGFGRIRTGDAITVATIGVAVALKGAVMLQTNRRTYGLPPVLGEGQLRIAGATVSTQVVFNLAMMAVAAIALTWFLRRTKPGTIMRAASDDREMVTAFGTPATSTARWAFIIAAVLGTLAGIGVTPLTVVSFETGTLLGLKGFSAAILGGIGNLYGAVLGGLALGIAEAAVGGYGSPAYVDAIAFGVLLLVLFVRPSGLLGRSSVVRV